MKNFSVIAAITYNRGIGYKGRLPWHRFNRDMQWFRKTTLGQTVIMGRKTFESIGNKPLEDRQNIVITRNPHAYSPLYGQYNIKFYDNLLEGISQSSQGVPYVIGGSGVYREAINSTYCQNIYLTQLDDRVNRFKVDTYFPSLSDRYKLSDILESDRGTVYYDKFNYRELPYHIFKYTRTMKTHHKVYLGEQGYLDALQDIIKYGEHSKNRTEESTTSLFGLQFRYDLSDGFPLFTTKKMFTKGIITELLWFLNGKTDAKILQDQNNHIWDGNTSREYLDSRGLTHLREGDGGPIYGHQFRHFGAEYVDCHTDYSGQGIDQVRYVLEELRKDIYVHGRSRRAVINLWNAKDIDKMSLPPCHVLYQFWVSKGKYLNCSMYQRSGDMGLGVPFNVASMSLMTHILAKLCDLDVGEIVHTVADAHIYDNHAKALQEQIVRRPYALPKLVISGDQKCIEDFKWTDFEFYGYHHQSSIKMDMVV